MLYRAESTTGMKTNEFWHPFPEYSAFFKLINGRLHLSPLLEEGSREQAFIELDFDFAARLNDESMRPIATKLLTLE
jgi:hypothetical protein